MKGMDATTGKVLEGKALLSQSIQDILMTPIGSRVMNRDYGSLVFDMLDHPGNDANTLRLYAVAVDALMRWEPRAVLSRIQIISSDVSSGEFVFDLEGITAEDISQLQAGSSIHLSIPVGTGS